MNKETRAIVTGMLGGLLLSITLSGRFTSYVKPGFKPMLLTAGALLVVLAVVTLVLAVRDDLAKSAVAAEIDAQVDDRETGHHHREAGHDGDEVDGHGHSHSTRAPWLMLVPVLVLLFVAPPALGEDAVTRGITCGTAAPDGTTYPSRRVKAAEPLPTTGPVSMGLQEFVQRSLYDSAYSTVHADIQVVGFIVRSSCDEGGYSLVRLKISCCAADAITLRTHIDGIPPVPANTWVQATIRAVKDTGDQGNNYVPTATVISMQAIPQPADPYET